MKAKPEKFKEEDGGVLEYIKIHVGTFVFFSHNLFSKLILYLRHFEKLKRQFLSLK